MTEEVSTREIRVCCAEVTKGVRKGKSLYAENEQVQPVDARNMRTCNISVLVQGSLKMGRRSSDTEEENRSRRKKKHRRRSSSSSSSDSRTYSRKKSGRKSRSRSRSRDLQSRSHSYEKRRRHRSSSSSSYGSRRKRSRSRSRGRGKSYRSQRSRSKSRTRRSRSRPRQRSYSRSSERSSHRRTHSGSRERERRKGREKEKVKEKGKGKEKEIYGTKHGDSGNIKAGLEHLQQSLSVLNDEEQPVINSLFSPSAVCKNIVTACQECRRSLCRALINNPQQARMKLPRSWRSQRLCAALPGKLPEFAVYPFSCIMSHR
ncbi:serine/Arginine-related protein 53 [Egretta garzetta]|uniref:serine/Arginine-related protein 53 n=1 Tax=Egretta garzetta TaxID=188379 RepID=UPI00163BB39F|nr:serine/Arginine-related protein 53 [Egretta garzetta]